MRKLLAILAALATALSVQPAYALTAPEIATPRNASATGAGMAEAAVAIEWDQVPGAVFYSATASATGQQTQTATTSCPVNPCSITFGDLAGGVSYEFTVTASDGDVESSDSVAFVAKSIPQAPVVVSSNGGVGSVRLSWTPPTNNGGSPITQYTITDGSQVTRSVDGDTRTLLISGLNAGAAYTFRIQARNETGSSASATFAAATVFRAPDAPSNVSATQNQSTITVTWDAPASNGGTDIQSYTAYLQRNGVDVGAPVNTGNRSASFSGLASGNYTVQVIATNIAGSSARSSSSNTVAVAGASLLPNPPQFSTFPSAAVEAGNLVTVLATAAPSSIVTLVVGPSDICRLSSGRVLAVAIGSCTVTANASATSTHSTGTLTRIFGVIATPDTPEAPDPEPEVSQGPTSPVNATVPLTRNPFSAGRSLAFVNADGTATAITPSLAADKRSLELRAGSIALVLRGGSGVTFSESGKATIASGSQFEFAASGYLPGSSVSGYLIPTSTLITAGFTSSAAQAISLGTTSVASDGSFTFATAITASAGNYLLQLSGTTANNQAITLALEAQVGGSTGSGSASYWPKKLSSSSIKLYAKNIVGVGKVQFRLNGKEIAWVRAVDESDPKLRSAAGSYYLVRTVKLNAGKNVVEIYVDGERVRRAAYTVR